jgi:hypothetical protein
MNIYSPQPDDEFFLELKNFKCKLDLSDSKFNFSCNVGKKNPMYGRRFNLTTEQKNKISQKQTGRPLSDSHKQSISKAKTGIPRSEETKRKISEGRRKSKLQA